VSFTHEPDLATGVSPAQQPSSPPFLQGQVALARDGVPLGLSIGFADVPGGSRWSPDRRRVTRTRAALDRVAVVRVPAYEGAGVVGVRGAANARPTPALLTLARLRNG
jgi:phage head maturation protease